MTGDPVLDSHLRAAIDNIVLRLHRRGFEIAPPATVSAALATGAGGDLNSLRVKTNAEIVVRVSLKSRERDRVVVEVEVRSGRGERTQTMDLTPVEVDTEIPFAVEALLPADVGMTLGTTAANHVVLSDGTIVPGRVVYQMPGGFVVVETADGKQRTIAWNQLGRWVPGGGLGTGSAPGSWSYAQPGAGRARDADSVPAASGSWNRRAGSLVTFDVQAHIVGVLDHTQVRIDKGFTSGQMLAFHATDKAGGGGGGLGLHLGYLWLHAPTVGQGSTWAGFRMGSGIDFAYLAYAYRQDAKIRAGLVDNNQTPVGPAGYAEGGTSTWTSATNILIPFQLGGQFGLGSFWGTERWSGVMVGVDYRPTYYHVKPAGLDASSGLNPLGFQLTVDIGSLQNTERAAPEANMRFSVCVLPPVNNRPMFLVLGIGAAWY